MRSIPGVLDIHDYHVWHLGNDEYICTMHIVYMLPTARTLALYYPNTTEGQAALDAATAVDVTGPIFASLAGQMWSGCTDEACDDGVCAPGEDGGDEPSLQTSSGGGGGKSAPPVFDAVRMWSDLCDSVRVMMHSIGVHSCTVQPEFVHPSTVLLDEEQAHRGHSYGSKLCNEPVCGNECGKVKLS